MVTCTGVPGGLGGLALLWRIVGAVGPISRILCSDSMSDSGYREVWELGRTRLRLNAIEALTQRADTRAASTVKA